MLEYLGRKEKGFTLMELLIAVAIVVILAGVGIPIYLKFQTGAKHAEASTNLNGIKLAEESYKLSNGTYLICGVSPRLVADIDQDAVAWADLATGFTDIGFSTSSDVRFAYGVGTVSTTAFVAEAMGDTDGDGTQILFIATETMGPHVANSDARDAALTLTLGALTNVAD
jgi:prepilin-type N-terminal cleavage/methylation domain-containing protein